MNASDYTKSMQGLLPQGKVWPREPDAWLTKLLQAWAEEFGRVDGRSEVLIDELDPRSSFELLPDFERLCGLPGECIGALGSLAERRQATHARWTGKGAQTPAYFENLAATVGYDATVKEFRPFCAGEGRAGTPACGEPWAHAWQLTAPSTTVRFFSAQNGTAGQALASWGNELLECVVAANKPAHTTLIFAYGS